MANTKRNSHIETDIDDDSTVEPKAQPAEGDFAYQDDDEPTRKPINLDTPVALADAIAAFEAAEKPAPEKPVQEKVVDRTPTPEPVAGAQDGLESKAITAELERLRAEARLANDNYLRSVADLQNFRRRGEEEKQRTIANANEKLIREILPILDDFDLAVGAAKKSESYEQLIGGVDAILRKFHDTLSKQGVATIPAVGEVFDTDLHEAVMVDESGDQPDDTVTVELRKGYMLNDRVIRPSLVKVAKQG